MAYWREYRNKYNALISRKLIYTAKDRAIQNQRKQTPRNVLHTRMYNGALRKTSIKAIYAHSYPEGRINDAIDELERDLSKMRTTLIVTRAIIAGVKPWGYTLTDQYGRSIGMHLSGHIPTIKDCIYDLEYRLKFHLWLKNSMRRF